ncbi:MAG: cardiolipin synthase [Verrucomicrobiales bacterium]
MDSVLDSLPPALVTSWRIAGWAIRIGAVFIIPHRRPPAQARAWLFFFLLMPLVALGCYAVFGRVYQPKRLARMRERVTRVLTRAAEQWNDRSHVEEAPLPENLQGVARLAVNLSGFPITRGNAVELFDTHPEGEEALIRDIESAQHHVHLMYYIFEDDRYGRRVADAVTQAARRGVACRVLMDAVGAAKGLKHLRSGLVEAGVEVVEMLPVGFLKRQTARFDLRNHRKIAVFDGCIAHVGSANIVEPPCRHGRPCEEIVLRITGPVASQFQVVFLGDRYLELEERIDSPDLFPPIEESGSVYAHVLPSGPLHDFSHTRKVLTSLIHNAVKRVCVTTPYFVPDATYVNALQAAALGGAEVHLIVPKRSDSLIVTYAQESFFEPLIVAGVRIHCYRPTLLHSKIVTIDGEIAVVGSANMDIRSLDLNREVSLLCYDRSVTAALERIEQRYMSDSTEITKELWDRRSLKRKFLQNTSRLFDAFL